jgi:hypothetical protein
LGFDDSSDLAANGGALAFLDGKHDLLLFFVSCIRRWRRFYALDSDVAQRVPGLRIVGSIQFDQFCFFGSKHLFGSATDGLAAFAQFLESLRL